MKIAIIGASNRRHKYGNKAVRAYKERGDEVFPINPAQGEIEGLKAYRSVLEVPGDMDIASFYVAPEVGLQVIEEVAQKGIRKVLLNPGAESDELLQRCEELGLDATIACSIILAGRSPGEF
ncbi:MAG TPA: CoA-binding protein [Abditibacteriaceae bacterium]|jgi:hypothetical protein